MNLNFRVTILSIFLFTETYSQIPKPFKPAVTYEAAVKRAGTLLQQMSVDEKISMIRGKGFHIADNERLGIPPVNFTDASQGVRLHSPSDTLTFEKVKKTVSFPPTIALAATWNTDLAYQYAYAIGEESRARAVNVLLGPGLNIYRNSQNGRNFEYLGEGPYLVSRMVENYVTGMQNTGTMAVIKHFVANNTEMDRRKSNSILDERTLHEIYMPGFKAGIDAGALGVMTSYNLLNGEWTGQSDYVINKLLRKDLGFKGLVMTDWTSVWDGEKVIKSGQNLEMPKGESMTNAKSLLEEGKVTIEQIDNMVKHIMVASIMMGFYDNKPLQKQAYQTFPKHEKIALQTAREAIVLLENKNHILPLKENAKILVIGKFVNKNAIGGGSGRVVGYDVVSMRSAVSQQFKLAYFSENPGDEELKKAPFILLSAGTKDAEAGDRNFTLNKTEEAEITRICSLNPNTIIVVNSGSGIKMTDWRHKAAAIIYAWYPGQNGQAALAGVVSGNINPSGKLPFTIEKDFKDSPAYGYVPQGKVINKNSPKNGDRSKVYDVIYKEGVFVGYRWYDQKKIEPLYPFGYGLSYTDFQYSNLEVDEQNFKNDGKIKVSFEVRNTGSSAGAEIAQLYVADLESGVERPMKELKGFKKVYLKKGEKQKIELVLCKKDFQYWHPIKKDWFFEPGDFKLMVGGSSADITLNKQIKL